MKSLLEETAGELDLTDCDTDGFTALHLAVRAGHLQVVEHLVNLHLRFGVTVDTVDNLGLTAYLHARRLGYKDISTVLRDRGLASVGHGDNLFRSPREWSQIGKFERRRAIQLKAVEESNTARILGKPRRSSNSNISGMSLPGSLASRVVEDGGTKRRKPPHHISASMPSLKEAVVESGGRSVSSDGGGDNSSVKPAQNILGNSEGNNNSQVSGSRFSLSSTDVGSVGLRDRVRMQASRKSILKGQQGLDQSQSQIQSQSQSQATSSVSKSGQVISFHSQVVTDSPAVGALSLLEQTSFAKGKLVAHFHQSQFDESKEREYKHILGNLNSIMDILSQQQSKSFRKSVEVKKPEPPPITKKKNKVSSLAIIFGKGGRKTPKRKTSPCGSSAKRSNKGSARSKKSSSGRSKSKSGKSEAGKAGGYGKSNKLPVPSIKIN